MTTDTIVTPRAQTALRPGWRTMRFGNVVRNVDANERNPREAGIERYVGLDHLDPESLHIKRWGLVEEGTTFTRMFKPGQVLFGKRRAYQRKAAVAEFEGICSGDILVFEPLNGDLIPELLPFIVQSDGFFNHALGTSAGSLSPRTKWKDLAEYEFALPPRDEQRRIAEILWAADEMTVAHETAYDDAIQLQQTLLTETLRPALGKETQWRHIQIDQLVREKIVAPPQDGNHGELHPKASDYREVGIPFVMANNVRDASVDLINCKFIPKSIGDKLRIGFSITDDILLTHKGTVGEVAIVPPIETEYIMLTPQVTYYRVLDSSKLNRDYLYFYFLSSHFQKQLSRVASQSTRDYVGITAQRKLFIGLPDINLQMMIARQLRKAETAISQLANHIAAAKAMQKALLGLLQL